MNKERLLAVLEAVKDVPEINFDMDCWWHECKSQGCAIGHYCLKNPNSELKLVPVSWSAEFKYFIPTFGELRIRRALAAFFEIDETEADDLFAPESAKYMSKAQFVSNLTQFIHDSSPNTSK